MQSTEEWDYLLRMRLSSDYMTSISSGTRLRLNFCDILLGKRPNFCDILLGKNNQLERGEEEKKPRYNYKHDDFLSF